jgi:hypothetical protein
MDTIAMDDPMDSVEMNTAEDAGESVCRDMP